MTGEEVLLKVIDSINQHGWGYGWNGPCLLNHYFKVDRCGLSNAMYALSKACGENIPLWNDQVGRTKEEVILVCYDAKRFL